LEYYICFIFFVKNYLRHMVGGINKVRLVKGDNGNEY
jgi:hypothetical protein